MNPALVDLVTQGFYLILMLSLPPIAVAAVVGLGFALFQSVTQLQEQTLSFGIKLLAVFVTLFLTGEWCGMEILRYGQSIFNYFYGL